MQAPAGSTVGEVLAAANITLNPLDRSDPPIYTVATDGAEIRIIRVEEELLIDQVVIPYEQQILRNESLPEGERRLVQPGVNGLQEITTRRVFEDGVEISNSPLKVVIVEEPVPEIVMVGSQSPYAAIPIPGKLVYISGGNAWVMEGSTGCAPADRHHRGSRWPCFPPVPGWRMVAVHSAGAERGGHKQPLGGAPCR